MNEEIYQIKQLLNLYYSGLSSQIDEKRLDRYFADMKSVPEELIVDRDLYIASRKRPHIEVPEDLGPQLGLLIDHLEHQEHTHNRGRRWITTGSVAAGVAIVISLATFFFFGSESNPYEITDPQIASFETEKALLEVSASLKRADKQMALVNDEITKIGILYNDFLNANNDEVK